MDASVHTAGSSPDTDAYELAGDLYDEAYLPSGEARPHYSALLEEIERRGPALLRTAVTERIEARGVGFGGPGASHTFDVDPVPRVMPADEWAALSVGLAQRVRALNAFLADAYGARRIVEAGIVPKRLLDSASYMEPLLAGLETPGGVLAHVAGLDLVRDPSGRLLVLEDNLRTPSGLTYAFAARDAVGEALGTAGLEPRPLDTATGLLAESLRSAAPDGAGDPSIALLSDGTASGPFYEHRELAKRLDVPLIEPVDLVRSGERLHAWVGNSTRQIDVIYRRCEMERLTDPQGRLSPLGEKLAGPLRSGTLSCVNAIGTGLADDKAVFGHVEAMISFYLDEEPLLPAVPSYDLGDPDMLAMALERLDELVIKPRDGLGGQGITIGAKADTDTLGRVAGKLREAPHLYIAQETVGLSRHPTVIDGRLAPRHVDLRPYVISAGEKVSVVPGGLTRFARAAGELVVNSSRGGGAKDTWVLA